MPGVPFWSIMSMTAYVKLLRETRRSLNALSAAVERRQTLEASVADLFSLAVNVQRAFVEYQKAR